MGAKASEQRRQSERGRNGEGEAKEDFFCRRSDKEMAETEKGKAKVDEMSFQGTWRGKLC